MDDIRHLDDSKMVTPNDVRRVKFTGKTSLFTRRDWYDADEVDDFLDEYVSVTIRELGHDAIQRFIDKSRHYIVIDESGNKVFETDSRSAVDSAIDSIKRFKDELSKDIPSDFLKGTQFDSMDG